MDDLLPLLSLPGLAVLGLGLLVLVVSKTGRAPKSHADIAQDCQICPRAILNKEERRLHDQLERLVAGSNDSLRLLAQVSLDEIFTVSAGSKKSRFRVRARYCQKRVDFVIVTAAFDPVCGIEYQGTGHRRGNAARRDVVKAQVFAAAKLPLIAVHAGYEWSQTEAELRQTLGLSFPEAPTAGAPRQAPTFDGRRRGLVRAS